MPLVCLSLVLLLPQFNQPLSPSLAPQSQAFSSYVLRVIEDYPTDGTHQYHWPKSGSWAGVTQDVYYEGQLIEEGDPRGRAHCSGITWEVFMRALDAYNRENNEKLMAGRPASEIKRFRSLWFGSAENHECARSALIEYGLGADVPTPDEAQRGDFVQLWRKNGSGHSVVFDSWVHDDAGRRTGIRYWSVQKATDGIGYRVETFDGAGGVDLAKSYIVRVAPEVRRSDEMPRRMAQADAVMRFPEKQPAGVLYVQSENGRDWIRHGDATGALSVPQGRAVRLDVFPEAAADPHLLDSLGDARVVSLSLSFTPSVSAHLTALARFPELETLDLSYSPVTDAELAKLAALPALRTLNLHHTSVGDAGIANLAGLTQLETLDLSETQVSDAGLARLNSLPRLRDLELYGTAVGNNGLASLAGAPALEVLNLTDTKVGDAGLANLAKLPRLDTVWLNGLDGVTNKGLDTLSNLQGLRRLGLANCAKITDKGLAALVKLSGLSELDLNTTSISNDGVAHLRQMKNLRVLHIASTRIRSTGREELVASLPDCRLLMASRHGAE